jgi:hypothetical protein
VFVVFNGYVLLGLLRHFFRRRRGARESLPIFEEADAP